MLHNDIFETEVVNQDAYEAELMQIGELSNLLRELENSLKEMRREARIKFEYSEDELKESIEMAQKLAEEKEKLKLTIPEESVQITDKSGQDRKAEKTRPEESTRKEEEAKSVTELDGATQTPAAESGQEDKHPTRFKIQEAEERIADAKASLISEEAPLQADELDSAAVSAAPPHTPISEQDYQALPEEGQPMLPPPSTPLPPTANLPPSPPASPLPPAVQPALTQPSEQAPTPQVVEHAPSAPLPSQLGDGSVPSKPGEAAVPASGEPLPQPEVAPSPAPSQQTKQQVPAASFGEPMGIVDKLVSIVFGKLNDQRDPKWAQPWQTHPEHHKVAPSVEEKPKSVAYVPGTLSKMFNKFVITLFGGDLSKERDEKWARPWQTHPEHSGKLAEKKTEEKPKPQVYVPTSGIIDKIVYLIFGEAKGPRDAKWQEPWQNHDEQKYKFKPAAVEKSEEVKKVVEASGGIFDKFVRIIFPEESKERDPKWAVPWQTHAEHKRESVVEAPQTVRDTKPGIIRTSFDKLVRFIFNLPSTIERDPKWAQPWQTHTEHVRRQQAVVSEPTVKTGGIPGFGFLDKLVTLIFPQLPTERDPKWSRPWQTHDEHKKVREAVSEVKAPVATPVGGPIDKLVKFLFNIKEDTIRDPKYERPWQTHEETRAFAPAPKTESPAPAQPPAAPIPTSPPTAIPAPAPAVGKAPAAVPIQAPVTAPTPELVPTVSPTVEKAEVESPPKAEAPKEEPKFPESPIEDFAGEIHAPTYPTPAASPAVDLSTPPETTQEHPSLKEEIDDEQIILVPSAPRSRDHIDSILGLDEPSQSSAQRADPIAQSTLRELKNIYGASVLPLESTFKYQDISNRHMSDAEIFSEPLVLLLGPYSTGKSTFLNYLLGIEYTRRALRTGANPSHGVFRIVQYGSEDLLLDGTALGAQVNFQSLYKFGQNFIDQLRGNSLNIPLLKKVTFVEAPGILEMRRPGERLYPFNDVLQWFIDRADLVLVMFDYTKLDAGYELEAVLDQLKGREAQVRILLNKADQIPPEELIKVQGSLFWNLSPLLGASAPPTVYAGSFSSRPYRPASPAKLFQAQEEALLHDLARAINLRVDNRVATVRRHAVRVRNHAQMVDTYLTTYNKNKGFLTSKHKLAEDIVENPHLYNIYEGMSLLTNISRYDLPDPEVYRDFFRVHSLYDFPSLRGTCSYLHGCPLEHIERAVKVDLPNLLTRYHQLLVKAGIPSVLSGSPEVSGSPLPPAEHAKGF